MAEIFKEFEISRDDATRHLAAYRGAGNAYLRIPEVVERAESQESSLVCAATYFRRAGLNALLLSDGELAREMFTSAASAYRRAGSFLAIPMATLAGVGNSYQSDVPERRDDGLPYRALNTLLGESEDFSRYKKYFANEVDELPGGVFGSLCAPIAYYSSLFDLILAERRHPESQVDKRLLQVLMAFFKLYLNQLARHKADKYHWALQTQPFHPLDPDMLFILTVVFRTSPRIMEMLMRVPEEIAPPIAGINALLGAFKILDATTRRN